MLLKTFLRAPLLSPSLLKVLREPEMETAACTPLCWEFALLFLRWPRELPWLKANLGIFRMSTINLQEITNLLWHLTKSTHFKCHQVELGHLLRFCQVQLHHCLWIQALNRKVVCHLGCLSSSPNCSQLHLLQAWRVVLFLLAIC